MDDLRRKHAFICDMDGVIYHGDHLLPRVPEFMGWLRAQGKPFLFLTNSSERSPQELSQKLARLGLQVGKEHFYTSVGKPNPLMMRHALKRLGCRREGTAIIGDRMDTDIIAGIESEIETVLVLSGVTAREDLPRFGYAPRYVLNGVGEIPG